MCNGIYFLWQYYLVPAATGREAAASQRLELGQQLQLISELPAEEVAATSEAAVAAAEEAPAPVVEEPALEATEVAIDDVTDEDAVLVESSVNASKRPSPLL